MATQTTHYNLTKPDPTDLVDVSVLNGNADIIDQKIFEASQSGGSSAMIETSVETSATSAHAYAAGDHFIYNGTLYRATAAIAIGDTITPGTNCEATTVAGELEGKVDKVTGKQLSTEDYTTAEKTKLSGIEAQANKTVIDDTLTNTGEAADAKTVGDEISDVKAMIEPSAETSATSVHAYAAGDHFIYNGTLYRATAAIAIGDTITPESNCVATTVMAEVEAGGGGGGGTSDYTQLSNKPQINGNTLTGNKTGADLGLVNAVTGKQLSTEDYTSAEKTKLAGIEAQANKTVIDSTLTQTGQAADAKAAGDAVSELRNTLSHKADVIYDTASGDIASFPDGADGLPVKDLTVAIEPVQSGTGDPSPDNVRPISGWTGANVSRTGKNYIDGTKWNVMSSTTAYVGITNISESISAPAGEYTFSFTFKNSVRYRVYFIYAEADWSTRRTIVSETGTSEQATLTVDGRPFKIWFYATSGSVSTENIVNAQLESGTNRTEFEPFAGATIPISWQSSAGTVYGGTLDVTSGVLTVTHIVNTMDGVTSGKAFTRKSDSASINEYYYGFSDGSLYGRTTAGNASEEDMAEYGFSCSHAKVSTSNDDAVQAKIYIGSSISCQPRLRLSTSSSIQTVEAMNAWVHDQYTNGTPVQFYIALKNAQTYQLDPVTVTTLLGQNNIWADCGPSTVEYPADTKLYIQKINTPTDDDMIADANIASGQYFIVNNNLYISTAAILAGDPIKPGTNCTLTNLAAALNALNS